MPTAQVIIEAAMRRLGVLSSGASGTADELADGLEALNELLDMCSAKSYLVPYRTRDDAMAVASAANSYSIGSGGDFNTARPIRIDAVTINNGSVPWVIKEGSLEEYNASKVAQQGLPDFFYYEPNYPTGTIYFPYQLSTSYTVTIDSLKPFTSFATTATSIDLPPGYEGAFKALLAPILALEYERAQMTPVLELKAQQAEDFLETQSNYHRKYTTTIDNALNVGGYRYNGIIDR